jgi:hypothetical protein
MQVEREKHPIIIPFPSIISVLQGKSANEGGNLSHTFFFLAIFLSEVRLPPENNMPKSCTVTP